MQAPAVGGTCPGNSNVAIITDVTLTDSANDLYVDSIFLRSLPSVS